MSFKIIRRNNSDVRKSCCHKSEIGQNNLQRMGFLFFTLQHNKKIRGHEIVFYILPPCPDLNKEALLKKPKLIHCWIIILVVRVRK